MSAKPWPAAAFLLALLCACQPEVLCPATGAACGGDPSGTWSVYQACREPVFATPVPVTYLGQPAEMARQSRPAMTSSDWCSSIFIGGGTAGVTSFTFPHDTLSPSGGQITYVSDHPQQLQGSYQAVIQTSGKGHLDLSGSCITRSGANLSCEMVAAALTRFAAVKLDDPGVPCTDSPDEPPTCQFYFSYQNITCAGAAGGGCLCTYDVSFAGTLKGRWSRDGGVLTHADASKTLPSQADYCASSAGGGTLGMWGHDRTSILDQRGIRTLMLRKTP